MQKNMQKKGGEQGLQSYLQVKSIHMQKWKLTGAH